MILVLFYFFPVTVRVFKYFISLEPFISDIVDIACNGVTEQKKHPKLEKSITPG